VSAPATQPGPQSLAALQWMSRVGAATGEPIALVMGWSIRAMHDHIARLVRAGLVRRVPMTRGQGSLIVITPEGAQLVGSARG
jgi:DNA-binding MarR family transcriptional regulator